MTIDEAIAQAERIAEGQEKSAELSPCDHAKERISKSAAEHRQFAAWLRDLRQAKAIILDMSYTLEVLCDKVNAEIGCSKCPYSDGGCRVKSWLTRQRDFCKAELIGGKEDDN